MIEDLQLSAFYILTPGFTRNFSRKAFMIEKSLEDISWCYGFRSLLYFPTNFLWSLIIHICIKHHWNRVGERGNWLALILTLLWISLLSISRWKKQNLVTFVSYCVPETTIPTGIRVKGSLTKYGLNSQSLLHLLQMLKFTLFIKKGRTL